MRQAKDNQGAVVLLVMAAVIMMILVGTRIIHPVDEALFQWFGSFHQAWLNMFFAGITFLGGGMVLAPLGLLIFLLLLWLGYRREALLLLVGVLGAELLNEMLKLVFNRTRPPGFGLVELPESASFPSGHAHVSTVFYGLLGFIMLRITRLHPVWVIIPSGLLILLISVSRVYLGVHYFSDVFTGILLGTAWLYVTIGWYQRGVARKQLVIRPGGYPLH